MFDAQQKKDIYTNLLNGVSTQAVAEAFCASEKEIEDVFRNVTLKIRSYCFERMIPLPPCENVGDARGNRIALLAYLDKVNLDVLPIYKSITTQGVDHGNISLLGA